MKLLFALFLCLAVLPARASTILYDGSLNIGSPDFDFSDVNMANCSVVRVLVSDLQATMDHKRVFLRVRTAAGLQNANGNYRYLSLGAQEQSSGQKPDIDSNGDEIDGSTSYIGLIDSPIRDYPNAHFNAIIEFTHPGSSAAVKPVYFKAVSFEDHGKPAYDVGAALAMVSAPLIGFRLYTGGNMVAGKITITCD